ncbi:MAG TPA: helix-turn-helix domain-containing protein [Syntrophorhabdaceae bacterium]
MQSIELAKHLSENELKRRMKAAKDHEHFQCWHCVYLASKGLPAKIVAEYVGTTTGAVHQWVRQYNHYGPDGFEKPPLSVPRPGFEHLP